MIDLLLAALAALLIFGSDYPITGIIGALVLCVSVPARMKIAEMQGRSKLMRSGHRGVW